MKNLSQYYQFFITCLLGFSLLIFITFEINNKNINHNKVNNNNNNNFINNKYYNNIKTIVAYSLQKQIEIETEQITDCNNNNKNNNNNTKYYNKILKNNRIIIENEKQFKTIVNEKDTWFNVIDSNLYYYSAYYDKRLQKYPYVRIIGMVQGKS